MLLGSHFINASTCMCELSTPRGPAGVRAQAMGPDGGLIDDFVFDGGDGIMGKKMLHVRNAPSPGATSSLAIAELVVNEAEKKFQWTD